MEQMSLISKKKGERIDKFLGENLGDLSRSYIQKLLKDGLILVNGKKVKANYKLNEGDQIDVEVPDPEPLDIAAENIANMDTTRTESGGPYRRKNVLLESYSDTSFAQAMEKAARGKGITSRHAGVRVSGIVEDDREAKKVYNPDHPDADADGYVTMPNVDVLKETVDSMSATRSYEANVTALNAIKLMAQKALEIGK